MRLSDSRGLGEIHIVEDETESEVKGLDMVVGGKLGIEGSDAVLLPAAGVDEGAVKAAQQNWIVQS